ncbi:hypothetical protein Z965_11910 [Clostridium novyi A str. BKT29909]|uniref:NEAT domain-containing protein n=1 Tax=Clostridium novyi TaxID=1542 RepID=UPI0004D694F8|nr:NEAT domain-containing protein [Clostridium novyi]KEH90546.1 hypothetical protein Z965_11910 [Clostridium novyi A str. BKT29909]
MDIIKNLNKGVGAAATAIIIIGGTPQVVHAATNNKPNVIEAKQISKSIEKEIMNESPVQKIKIQALKLNKDEPSMAGQYIENEVTYTEENGKIYCSLKILASDWMNDIKVKVNGDEAKCQLKDIGKTEVFGAEHKGAILKFEVPKINPDIKLNMFVVPMNSKVEFRIVGEENKKTDKENNQKETNTNSKKNDVVAEQNNKANTEKIKDKEVKNEDTQKKEEKTEAKDSSKEKVFDNLEDGVYTLTFRAYKIENPAEDSMLNNFFDKKAKLEVKDGKKTITFLNICFADGLYDFRIETNKIFKESQISDYGNKNPDTEKYPAKLFKMEIDDLDSDHKGCVLAGPMGGKLSDYGKVTYDKANNYKTVMFKFNKDFVKGWNGFDSSESILKENDNGNLNKALIEIGLDTDKDGTVSVKELSEAKGRVDLSKKKITDISQLKALGPEVTELDLSGNRIEQLPKGIFDNLTQLTYLDLRVNKIKELPDGIFDKLVNLKKVYLERNKLETLPKGVFDKLPNLETVVLATNNIKHLDDDVFKNNKKLKFIDVSQNEIDSIPTTMLELNDLETFCAKQNRIEVIPQNLTKLKNLTWLDLASNYIEEIPEEILNGKNSVKYLYLAENMLKEVPNKIFEAFPKVNSYDFVFNNLKTIPKAPEGTKKTVNALPQKSPMNLKLEAKDGEIKWNEELSTFDILAWQRTTHSILGEKMPENVEEYKKHLNGKTALELLNKEGYEPKLKIIIQKKDKDGKFKTIKEIINDGNGSTVGSIKDPEMKANDEYRILEELRTNFYGDDQYVFTNVAHAKVEESKKNSTSTSNKQKENNKNSKENKIDDSSNKADQPNEKKKEQDKRGQQNKVTNAESKSNKKATSIKEKKLPQTGMPVGSGLLATLGSAIYGMGVVLMRKNKKKK